MRAHIWPGHQVSVLVRLDGVDAPELRGADCPAERRRAEAARDALTPLIAAPITLTQVRLGKFAGRVVARLVTLDGRDVSEDLLAAGLAVPYGDEARWCAWDLAASE